jgi:hypothetical protein
MSSAALVSPTPFSFAGRAFVCAALRTDTGLFQPVVMYQAKADEGGGVMHLPFDSEPYETVAEALRHGEQQVVRWMHDCTSNGQGRF